MINEEWEQQVKHKVLNPPGGQGCFKLLPGLFNLFCFSCNTNAFPQQKCGTSVLAHMHLFISLIVNIRMGALTATHCLTWLVLECVDKLIMLHDALCKQWMERRKWFPSHKGLNSMKRLS